VIKPAYVNPRRRDLLKQLLAIGAVGAGASVITGRAQTVDEIASSTLEAAWQSDAQYNALRQISLWRTNIPARYPDVIVQAPTEDDVREALAFARNNDMQIACRASGHNTAGAPLRNGGMMLFTSGLNGIEIDPDARTAKIQPAANMAALFSAAQKHGLDFPTADCASVALGGFILGGGLGRNDNYLTEGPCCKALVSAEVMLADGEIVTVDENHYSDIFWAMRGCGPAFFGIVMSMTLQLFDPPGAYIASHYNYRIDSLSSLLYFLDAHQSDQNPQVRISLGIGTDENDPDELLVQVGLYSSADQGPAAVAVARSRLEYYVDEGLPEESFSRSEFVAQDPANYMMMRDRNIGTHTDNIYTDDSSSLLPAAELFKSRPEGLDVRLVMAHNGQMHAPHGDDICFSAGGHHFLSIYVNWSDSQFETLAYEWTDRFSELARPFAQGHYLNQIDTGVYPEKVRGSFPDSKWERLALIRKKYDPYNRFFTFVGHEA
jgi:hypothetical protein